MDSIENKNPFIVICFRPPNFKEDFRSTKFRNLPIVVLPLDRDEKNGFPPPDITNPFRLCTEKIKDAEFRFYCTVCHTLMKDLTTGYYLSHKRIPFKDNKVAFHKECIQPLVKNPHHPKHSLQILTYPLGDPSEKICHCCDSFKQSFHYCSICDFRICRRCVRDKVLHTIDHKRHEHTLTFICREASMTCDVCGLDDRRYFIYACHQCDFVVHKECIYFPSIVKISRHEHRISFTSFLNGEMFCGVCRGKIDENYGVYSCVKGCSYVVHSNCVVYGDVWDGKELEGKPEDAYEDIKPFKEIGERIIKHFSHNHYMKLQEETDHKANEENNRCQACTLPVYDGDTFSCMECDYLLHKACAYLPMRKQYAIYSHPLDLEDGNRDYFFWCSACNRNNTGFSYKYGYDFMLDMHCASVSEPFNHQCHIHPLFLPSKSGSKRKCSICESSPEIKYLECGECEFVMCFGCATLPKKFKYKYDEHPLTFSFENDARNRYWCEACEEKINPKHGVYMCKDCDVTLHIHCLLGEEMYILPGKMLSKRTHLGRVTTSVILNNHLTRYICKFCGKRCEGKIVYKSYTDEICCSISCHYMRIVTLHKINK